jgi:methionyl-tRNA synthetase
LDSFDIQTTSNLVWKNITDADQLIQEKAPFKLIKTDKASAVKVIQDLCGRLYVIGTMLDPILPKTAEIMRDLVKNNKMPTSPLFLRKE